MLINEKFPMCTTTPPAELHVEPGANMLWAPAYRQRKNKNSKGIPKGLPAATPGKLTEAPLS
jgi:hypothetical protein